MRGTTRRAIQRKSTDVAVIVACEACATSSPVAFARDPRSVAAGSTALRATPRRSGWSWICRMNQSWSTPASSIVGGGDRRPACQAGLAGGACRHRGRRVTLGGGAGWTTAFGLTATNPQPGVARRSGRARSRTRTGSVGPARRRKLRRASLTLRLHPPRRHARHAAVPPERGPTSRVTATSCWAARTNWWRVHLLDRPENGTVPISVNQLTLAVVVTYGSDEGRQTLRPVDWPTADDHGMPRPTATRSTSAQLPLLLVAGISRVPRPAADAFCACGERDRPVGVARAL
jgi:hypothetical protein